MLRCQAHGELAQREAGIAVFFAELAHASREAAHLSIVRQLLARSAIRMESVPMTLGLFAGVSGIAWAVNLAREYGIIEGENGSDPCADVDAVIFECVRDDPGIGLDVITGLAGITIYALARSSHPGGQALMKCVTDRLLSTAEVVTGGILWPGPDNPLTPAPADVSGIFPIGLAHGAAGVIAVLSRVRARCEDLVSAATLRSACYAVLHVLAPNLPFAPRLRDREGRRWGAGSKSWCWGDLGVALALFDAGRQLRDNAIIDTARLWAASVAEGTEPSDYGDPSLCHGWASAACASRCWFFLTGDQRFQNASERFRSWLLHYRGERAFGGYEFFGDTGAGELTRCPAAGLLSGSAGVGLALLSLSSSRRLRWESLFLLDASA